LSDVTAIPSIDIIHEHGVDVLQPNWNRRVIDCDCSRIEVRVIPDLDAVVQAMSDTRPARPEPNVRDRPTPNGAVNRR
jgi:hypothetical protein